MGAFTPGAVAEPLAAAVSSFARILDRLLSVWYDAVFDRPAASHPIGAVAKW